VFKDIRNRRFEKLSHKLKRELSIFMEGYLRGL